MIQSILITISLLVSVFTLAWKTPATIWDAYDVKLGTTSFPTSLDALTNPSATDPVNNPSHSSQHANANDAIEAVETKTRIDGSISGGTQVFASNGTNSGWTTYATTSFMTSANFLATGSSTFQAFTGTRATTTLATSTNFFATTASSTDLYSTTFRGGGLGGTCTGTSYLQWTGGTFSCATSASSLNTFSTTTTTNMATTSIRAAELPAGTVYDITITSPDIVGVGAATTTTEIWFAFNTATDGSGTSYTSAHTSAASTARSNPGIGGVKLILQVNGGSAYRLRSGHFTLINTVGMAKTGFYEGMSFASTTSGLGIDTTLDSRGGRYFWASTTLATSIDIWTSVNGAFMATGTQITVFAR